MTSYTLSDFHLQQEHFASYIPLPFFSSRCTLALCYESLYTLRTTAFSTGHVLRWLHRLTLPGDLESLKIAADAPKAIIVINKCDHDCAGLEPLLEDTRGQLDTHFNGTPPLVVRISCRDADKSITQPLSKRRPLEIPIAVSLHRTRT